MYTTYMNENTSSNPFIYVVLNGELNMSPGKAAAQTAHAVAMLDSMSLNDFTSSVKRTVIVLEAKNAAQIENLQEYLSQHQVDSDYYIDEGYNEVDAFSTTALAAYVGEFSYLKDIFSSFPLFPAEKGVDTKIKEAYTTLDRVLVRDRHVKNVVKRLKSLYIDIAHYE